MVLHVRIIQNPRCANNYSIKNVVSTNTGKIELLFEIEIKINNKICDKSKS